MAKVITSWSQLEYELQQKMRMAMEETVRKGYLKACENAIDFYSEGSPQTYERTGKYGDAPDTDGVEGSGNQLSARIYMNPSGHGYTTGTFSTIPSIIILSSWFKDETSLLFNTSYLYG